MSTASIVSVPSCHRRDGLDPAEDVDLVGPGQRHRRHRLAWRPAVHRRRARDRRGDTGDLRRHDAHVGRRHHRVAAARHVAAHALHRDVLVAEHHAGQRSRPRRRAVRPAAPWRSGGSAPARTGCRRGLPPGPRRRSRRSRRGSAGSAGGDQRSRRSERARTAASPPARTSAMSPVTASATSAVPAGATAASFSTRTTPTTSLRSSITATLRTALLEVAVRRSATWLVRLGVGVSRPPCCRSCACW